MKIYPSNHSLDCVKSIDMNNEIPLAYINSDYIEETVTLNVNKKYNYDKIKEILPYDEFISQGESYPEITLYDRNNIAITAEKQSEMLNRDMNSYNYIYIPKVATVFEPYSFTYKVITKKNIKYMSSRKYNMRMACTDKKLANILIQYFANIYGENLFPNNISFNNGDKSIDSLINSSLDKSDFIFINSNDGKNYNNDKGEKNKIDIDEFLKYNTIPFIICEEFPGSKKIEKPVTLKFKLKKNIALNTGEIDTKSYLNIPADTEDIIYHKLFKYDRNYAPIVIEEVRGKGHIIYCHKGFISELQTNYLMFYEILLFSFLNGYATTKPTKEWITDVMPNYIVQNGRLTQKDKFTSQMQLHKLLELYEDDATPIEVEITPPKEGVAPIVYYTGMSSNYLVFKKILTKEYSDPIKNDNQISIFTSNRNVMYYDDFIYSIEENIKNKIVCKMEAGTLIITIYPFKNTYLDTKNFRTPIRIEYKSKDILSQTIYLTWNQELKTIELLEEYNNKLIILSEILINKDRKSTKLYDMRKRGGGISPDEEDNYDCLDIANNLGKSYRKGGTLITTIRMPQKYQERKDEIYNIIYESLKKNMVCEDYLVLNLDFK